MIRRINWELVLRIAEHLQQEGKMKKTRLAMVCHMKYVSCRSYLEWMEKLDLVVIGRHVQLTERGRDILT